MATLLEEFKVRCLGIWHNDRVNNEVIAQINTQIQKDSGSKATLQLSSDGFRVVKSTLVQGRVLQEFIPLERVQFVTVSQRTPDLLWVISRSQGQTEQFQISAFRCPSGLEAGRYTQAFLSLQRTARPVKVITGKPVVTSQEDDINWTLRSKEQDNSKRELKRLVDIQGQKAVVHANGDIVTSESKVVQNGHTEQYTNGVRIPLYRKGKPESRTGRLSTDSDEKHSELDSRSEVSESALAMELESLTREVRDMKLLIEKSTGVVVTSGGSGGYNVVKVNSSEPEQQEERPGSVRVYSYGGTEKKEHIDFKPMNVTVHTHTVKPETVVVQREEPQQNGTVIVEGESVQMRNKGYHVGLNGSVAEVRVSVPDYRTPAERTSEIEVSAPRTEQKESGYGSVTSRSVSTTSYDDWKRNTLERNAIHKYNDGPERLRWQSQSSSRKSHYVSVRPRSALPSWSSDATNGTQYVEVRRHPVIVTPHHQQIKYQSQRKTQSLRMKGLSTTVARPIERVYTGRPDAKHRSLSYRPHSASMRSSIIVKDEPEYVSPQELYYETNNNVVKADPVDTEPLDVSGIDLYKETHTEGAVIRT